MGSGSAHQRNLGRPGRSGLQMALIGILAGLAGFAIGLVIGAAPG